MIFLLWILIQIIGESLPISSSGHVELMQRYFHVSFENAENFNFLLHGPAIIILLLYFFSTWWNLVFHKKSFSDICKAVFFTLFVDIITFVFWKLQLSKLPWIQNYFLPIGFLITILCLYFSQYQKKDKNFSWSINDAFVLGIAQGLCLLPGISRFAGTYATGVYLGYDRKQSVSISFLIQFPLLCAAFLQGILSVSSQSLTMPDFAKNWIVFTVVIASVVSYALFCWTIKLIEQNRLWYFAFYMMIPMVLSLWILKGVLV